MDRAEQRPTERRGALDGLRAIAVVAVVGYHVDPAFLPGGFVGVDLFFVLSGYLITTLLLVEHDHAGRISLRRFWARRIRRLWPLAWLTLAGIAIASVAGVWGPDRQRSLPTELGSALAHFANWWQIGHGGYVASLGAPSPVQHFWSLAIEEQFYLVWPIIMVALLGWAAGRRARRWVVPTALIALACASLATGFAQSAHPDRAYLGTDVRAVALIIGAGLAWLLRGRPLQPPAGQWARAVLGMAGTAGAVALGVAAWRLDASSSWLARGGFALIGLAGAGMVGAAIAWSPARTLLGWRPLVALGRISFAIYLVHWPLLVAIGPGRPIWLRALVGFPGSIALAALAHRLVERPVIERRIPLGTLAGRFATLAAIAGIALWVASPIGATPTETVSASLHPVADPVPVPTSSALPAPSANSPSTSPSTSGSTVPLAPPTTACVPGPPTAAGHATGMAATIQAVHDPSEAGCGGQLNVLIVGDSTGRGVANGLVDVADPSLRVWDRTVLGCSFGSSTCPDWRSRWTTAVNTIHPDVVVLYAEPVTDLQGVTDSPFMSAAESALRAQQMTDGMRLLGSTGAHVLVATVAVPLRPNGLFFCGGSGHGTPCDPTWIQAWDDALRASAGSTGAGIVDTAGWIASRGSTHSDRPDGVHLAGAPLQAEARWLIPQIRLVAGR